MDRRNFLKGFLATATVVALAPLAPVVELPIAKAVFDKSVFEQIAAVTLEKYRPLLADAFFASPPSFFKYKYKGELVELISIEIVEPFKLNTV